jgi:4-hydroxy-tetrahydrodipicolinate reductase
MKPSLIVSGAAGRMGKRILALAVESGEFTIVAALERPDHPDLGKDAGLVAGIGELDIVLEHSHTNTADVMIDFSLPDAVEHCIDVCIDSKIGLVMGTTGLTTDHQAQLRRAAEHIPVIYGTNMSVGMNVLFHVVGKVAAMLGEPYDIEIVEAHHRFKKDSPSGSAMSLAAAVCKATGRSFPDCLVHGRVGKETLRTPGTIGMHAIRAGDITGEHSVIFSTLGETVRLEHSAHNRDNFVRGALRAALWLTGKQPGMYSMADVLGIA